MPLLCGVVVSVGEGEEERKKEEEEEGKEEEEVEGGGSLLLSRRVGGPVNHPSAGEPNNG